MNEPGIADTRSGIAALCTAILLAEYCRRVGPNVPETRMRGTAGILIILGSWVHGGLAGGAQTEQITESFKLSAPDPSPSGNYGEVVAHQGDRAAFREKRGDSALVHVSVFDGRRWSRTQTLISTVVSGFGEAMSMDGDWLAISAPDSNAGGSGSGSIHVFEWGGASYQLRQRLDGSRYEGLDEVSLGADVLVVGAHERAVIFRREGGVFAREQVLQAPFTSPYTGFGEGVTTDGRRVVVGAPSIENLRDDDGTIFVFEHDGQQWAQTHAIVAEQPRKWLYLGRIVRLDGDTVLAGCPGFDTVTKRDIGAAYFFELDADHWVEQQVLPSLPVRDGRFGAALDLRGDTAVIGALDSEGATVFRRDGGSWTERFELNAREDSTVGVPGKSVAIGERHVLQGDPGDDEGGEDAGAVLSYFVADLPMNGHAWGQQTREAGFSVVELLPASPFLLAVVEVDGGTLFHSLGLRRADLRGRVDDHWIIPPTLQGLEVSLQGFGFERVSGRATATNVLPLDL